MTHVYYNTRKAPLPNSFPSTSLKWMKIIMNLQSILHPKHPCLTVHKTSLSSDKNQLYSKKNPWKRLKYKWLRCITPKIKKKLNLDSISNQIKTTESSTCPIVPTNANMSSLLPKPTFLRHSTATVSSRTTCPLPVPLFTRINCSKLARKPVRATRL